MKRKKNHKKQLQIRIQKVLLVKTVVVHQVALVVKIVQVAIKEQAQTQILDQIRVHHKVQTQALVQLLLKTRMMQAQRMEG